MKKVLYLATLLFCAVFTSCEKEIPLVWLLLVSGM